MITSRNILNSRAPNGQLNDRTNRFQSIETNCTQFCSITVANSCHGRAPKHFQLFYYHIWQKHKNTHPLLTWTSTNTHKYANTKTLQVWTLINKFNLKTFLVADNYFQISVIICLRNIFLNNRRRLTYQIAVIQFEDCFKNYF